MFDEINKNDERDEDNYQRPSTCSVVQISCMDKKYDS